MARCHLASWPSLCRRLLAPGDRAWVPIDGANASTLAQLGIGRARCPVAFTIDADRCVDHINVGYAHRESHFLVETARDLQRDPAVPPAETHFARHVGAFQPRYLRDVFFEAGACPEACRTIDRLPAHYYANGMPWSTDQRLGLIATSVPTGPPVHFGPCAERLIVQEINRLGSSLEDCRRGGYRPTRHYDGFIRGFLLRAGSDYRFVITAGKHRMAVLACLGWRRLDVVFEPNDFMPVVDVDRLQDWPQVRSGLFSAAEARAMILMYFAGTERQAVRLRDIAKKDAGCGERI